MKRSPYNERDYSFGQDMLHLRTSIGLTQSGLAKYLGVSRRAVGEWEAGSSYPKGENLKQLIELAIKQRAFPKDREEEAICELWAAAHQKTLLDEQWLSSLLKPQHPLPPPITLLPQEEISSSQPVNAQLVAPGPLIDWGQALTVLDFYGREQETTQLIGWVLQERCQVVSLLGMGGIGKSALAVQAMHRLAEHFDAVIFRSLRDAPSSEELLDDCLQMLAPQMLRIVPTGLEQRLTLLLEELRTSRILLVLDNLETLLQEGDVLGHPRPGFEGYERLLRLVAETAHQSCLLLTSREKPAVLRSLEGRHALVRSLHLTGLDTSACVQLLTENEVEGTPQEKMHLIEVYGGNPLALKMVTETIADIFGGQISQFLIEETVIFGTIADLLQEQFVRLSSLEQTVLYWLAIVREPITLHELLTVLVTSPSQIQIFEAIDSLRRRSLVERGKRQGSFTLQSVVLEYVTRVLIEETTREIQQADLAYLIHYSLEQATAREYVRQTQERLLLAPILANLQNMYRGKNDVEKLLLCHLDELRKKAEYAQGYGPANLIALLRLHRGHLKNLDLSHLAIREAYLQGIEMQDTSLAGAIMRNTVFTEALDAVWGVAVSSNGQYWAVGSKRGEVRVWKERGRILHQVWQAHTNTVYALAFSPDNRTLATGSWDSSVKLWDLESGAQLWIGWHTKGINTVAFTPNGDMLASGGHDAAVQVWDPHNGMKLQTLPHPGPVYVVTWSPGGHLLASGDFEGNLRLWEIQQTLPATCMQMIPGHTNRVMGLAFSPNGSRLASGSWDQTVKLWETANGCLLQAHSVHTDQVNRVAWSPDGRYVASCSYDKAIWLWDIEQDSYRTMQHRHGAVVHSIAFSDNNSLLSANEDGTLRIWEVVSGQCLHVVQGYAVSISDIAWSLDGRQLASGGTDGLVTVWEVIGGRASKVLRGHGLIVSGVGWSPDGRKLASCGWDNAIFLRDAISGSSIQILRDPDHADTQFFGVDWSPDGRLLASGTYMRGLQVWDVATCRRRWVAGPHPTWIYNVAWSPDGTRLASTTDYGSVYLWDSQDGTLLRSLQGHCGIVNSVAWNAEGNRLVSCSGEKGKGELYIWNVESGECERDITGFPGVVCAVAWNTVKNLLISGDSDGMLCWWEIQSGNCIRRQEAHQGTIRALKLSPDGYQLASCGDDGAIRIWDLQNTELQRTLRHDRPYERLNITGITGLSNAQKSTLQALGATEELTTFL